MKVRNLKINEIFSLIGGLHSNPVAAIDSLLHGHGGSYDVLKAQIGTRAVHILCSPRLVTETFTHPAVFQKLPLYSNLVSLYGNTGVFTSRYNEWQDIRLRTMGHIAPGRFAGYDERIRNASNAVISKWQQGGTNDLYGDMQTFALLAFFGALFDFDATPHTEDLKRHIATLDTALYKSLINPLTHIFKDHTFTPPEVAEALAYMKGFMATLCARDLAVFREDSLISQSLAAHGYYDSDDAAVVRKACEKTYDEIVQLLVAGYGTTSSSMTWTMYALAARPELQEALRAEASDKIGLEKPGAANVQGLAQAQRVALEAVRLNPTLYVSIPRRAEMDFTFEDGYKIRRKDYVIASVDSINRDPRWHAAPEEFDESRQCPHARRERPTGADLSFLVGAHMCPGRFLFLNESSIFMTELLRNLTLLPPERVPPRIFHIDAVPASGYGMRFAPRQSEARCPGLEARDV